MSELNWTPDPPNGKDEQGNYILSQCHVPYWNENGEKQVLFVIWTDKEGTSFNLRSLDAENGAFETIQDAKDFARIMFDFFGMYNDFNLTNPNL